jgi:hypothetical protein
LFPPETNGSVNLKIRVNISSLKKKKMKKENLSVFLNRNRLQPCTFVRLCEYVTYNNKNWDIDIHGSGKTKILKMLINEKESFFTAFSVIFIGFFNRRIFIVQTNTYFRLLLLFISKMAKQLNPQPSMQKSPLGEIFIHNLFAMHFAAAKSDCKKAVFKPKA